MVYTLNSKTIETRSDGFCRMLSVVLVFFFASPVFGIEKGEAGVRETTCQILIGQVVAEPDNFAHRLRLADELEKLGFAARARLIRNSLKSNPQNDWERQEKELIDEVLVGKHGRDWHLAGVGPEGTLGYINGMVESVAMDARAFQAVAPRVLARAPIRSLTLRAATPEILSELAQAGHLGGLSELRLVGCEGCESALASLHLYAPRLKRLAVIDSQMTDYDIEASALEKSPLLRQLEALDLSRNYVTEAGVKKLLDVRGDRPLTELRLDGNVLGPTTLPALFQHASLRGLKSLSLRNTWGAEGMPVGDILKLLPDLEVLDLSSNRLSDGDLTGLANLPSIGKVHSLKLSNLELSAKALEALAKAKWLSQVRSLDLSHNAVAPALLRELSGQGGGSLRSLDLSFCRMGSDGLGALLSSGGPPKVTHLNLAYNNLFPKDAALLAAAPIFYNAYHVDFSGNAIGDAGLAALFRGGSGLGFPASLTLTGTGVTGQGLLALAKSPRAEFLRVLDLSLLKLDKEGVTAIEILAARTPTHPLKVNLRGAVLSVGERKRLDGLDKNNPLLFLEY